MKTNKHTELRLVVECPECHAVRSRRYDLMRHLVERHGYDKERAVRVSREVLLMDEWLTSVRVVSVRGSRYEESVPRGE